MESQLPAVGMKAWFQQLHGPGRRVLFHHTSGGLPSPVLLTHEAGGQVPEQIGGWGELGLQCGGRGGLLGLRLGFGFHFPFPLSRAHSTTAPPRGLDSTCLGPALETLGRSLSSLRCRFSFENCEAQC